MLKNIPKIISPELLKILSEMGHGDFLVIADGNFPSENYGKRVVRADGHSATDILDAVLTLFPLDTYVKEPILLMETVVGDEKNPPIWENFKNIIDSHDEKNSIGKLERFEFYEKAKNAYVIIATGEGALYGNIILQKGVIK